MKRSRRFVVAIVSLAGAAAVMGAGTLAPFADSETSTAKASAGRLDLQLDSRLEADGTQHCDTMRSDPHAPAVVAANLAPAGGSAPSAASGSICLRNRSTVGASLTLSHTAARDWEFECSEPEWRAENAGAGDGTTSGDCGTGGELVQELGPKTALQTTLWVDTDCDAKLDGAEMALATPSTDVRGLAGYQLPSLAAGAHYCLGVQVAVAGGAGNEAQSDLAVIDFEFHARQQV